jgi:molecular chaperone Hsp33
LVLAADGQVAAGLLIQRLPLEGVGNLAGSFVSQANEDEIGINEHYNRIAILASTLKREELLTLDVETILRRLFWEETLTRFEPMAGDTAPHFSCTCSRERVSRMILGLGVEEAQSVIAERGEIEVGCEFCGAHYRFDPIDAAQIFRDAGNVPPASDAVQ